MGPVWPPNANAAAIAPHYDPNMRLSPLTLVVVATATIMVLVLVFTAHSLGRERQPHIRDSLQGMYGSWVWHGRAPVDVRRMIGPWRT
jgi:hypothetical protein